MELRHLRYFVAAAEREHFGRAAKALRIAQPALSQQVRQLEDELGVGLFVRLPRGVRLSAAGRSFLDDCTRLLAEVDRAAARARRAGRGQVGVLRLGFVESASWHGPMPAAIRAFRSEFPEVELDVVPVRSRDALEAVLSRRCDGSFLYHRAPDDRTAHVHVQDDDVVLAVPRRHRFARKARLRLRDLAEEPFVATNRSSTPEFYDRVLASCVAGGVTPRIVQHAVDTPTVLSLVSAGIGIAVVSGAARWRRPAGMVLRPIGGLSVPIQLDFIWARDNASPVLARFVEVLQAEL